MTQSRFSSPWLAVLLGLTIAATGVNGLNDQKKVDQKKDEPKKDTKAAAKEPTKVTAPKPATPGQSHVVVVKDSVTGKLRPPTAEEAAELSKKQPPQTKTPPRMVRGPNGSVGMVLDESSAVYAVGTKGADNKISTKEVTGKAAATKAVEAPSKRPETRKDDHHEK